MKTILVIDGHQYLKVTPAKTLFHSTMVHEVVNRGDVFVVRLDDNVLTILDGNLVRLAEASVKESAKLATTKKTDTVTVARMRKEILEAFEKRGL